MSGKPFTTEKFIDKAKLIHGDKYDYSLVDYKGSNKKVKIMCPIHGVFEQIPRVHISQKSGCPQCYYGVSLKICLERFKKIHGNNYDYSLVNYHNNNIKVKIICKTHGIFEQSPDKHWNGEKCPKCQHKNLTTDDVIILFKKIHGNKYDYSLVNYQGLYKKVKIICSIHGVFEQKPSEHKRGCGCQSCKQSKGENKIENWLLSNNINFIKQYKFNNCKIKKKLMFDFYLPNYNLCIEFDGEQHYKGWWKFSQKSKRKLSLKNTQKSDKIKTKYCKINGIKLLRIPYWKIKNIETILSDYLNSQDKI